MTDHHHDTQLNSNPRPGHPGRQGGNLTTSAEATLPLYCYPIVWAAALAVALVMILGLVASGQHAAASTVIVSTTQYRVGAQLTTSSQHVDDIAAAVAAEGK